MDNYGFLNNSNILLKEEKIFYNIYKKFYMNINGWITFITVGDGVLFFKIFMENIFYLIFKFMIFKKRIKI